MSAPRPSPLKGFFHYALAEREYRALDRALPLMGSIALSLVALSVSALYAARELPSFATPLHLGRRLFHVYFGLSYLAVLFVSPLLGAWLSSPEHGLSRRELLSLAGVSPGALVRARLAASLGYLGSVIVASSPIAAVSFFYDGQSLAATAVALLSLLVCAALGSLLGQSLGANTTSPRAAMSRALLASTVLTLSAWQSIGRSLGRALCASVHLGYHGSAWWPEIATHAALDPGTRRTLLLAPFVLSIFIVYLLHTLAARASAILRGTHTLELRLGLIASSFALADVIARVCVHTQHTRSALAQSAAIGITVLSVFDLAILFVVLGEPLRATEGRGGLFRRALERSLGRSMLPGVVFVLGLGAAQTLGLARRVYKLINDIPEGPSLALWEPAAVAWVLFSHLVFAAGLGGLLRVLLPRGGARPSLAFVLGALWLLPAPVRFILGGAESSFRMARWVMSLSPWRMIELVEGLARSSLTRSDLRMVSLRSMPELGLGLKVTACVMALGALMLLASALSRAKEK